MNLSVGIVGLPNVGKSTLFNALLKRQIADASNYPFCTIEPNVGVVEVPDARLSKLAEIIRDEYPDKKDDLSFPPLVPAVVKFVDIAGLVKGAAEGEGLGNKFLSHIREVDVICHVVRTFSDPNVVHVAGEVDPKRDIEIVNSELILADLSTLKKSKEAKTQRSKEEEKRKEIIEKVYTELNNGKLAKDLMLVDEEKDTIKLLQLLTMKPVIYVANVSEDKINESLGNETMKQFNNQYVAISAKIESELSTLSAEDAKAYLKELGLSEPGLDRLIKLAYKTLGLISFLTAGEKEVRAWTIVKGMLAPQAAGVIHTDFEKGFIKVEVASFDDYINNNGWAGARNVGKLRIEGREYVMQDGDVVEFKVNA